LAQRFRRFPRALKLLEEEVASVTAALPADTG
jgi:hypothetical protein